jgi:glycerol-3-phosphate acyltransferase PlsY
VRLVGTLAGISVVLAYLIGSIPFGYLLHRRRLRRDMRRVDHAPGGVDAELRSVLAGTGPRSPLGTDLLAGALDTGKVLFAATLAWRLVEAAPPHHINRTDLSAVAFVGNQVLVGWQSTALWAGLAAVVAHLAPRG